ncbi:MAG: hypothetical protein Q8P50_02075 [Bacillota bacterium]|nr:hypothetical protein [Bacillota bacterium]
MALEYSPIQSLEAVEPVLLFGGLYYAWMAVLVSLLLLEGPGGASVWRGLALVVVFALIYWGFWDIPLAANKYADSVLNAATTEYIRSAGEIPFGHPNIIYTDFPGLHTLTAALASVTGLATPDAVTVMTVLMDLLLAGIFYLICLRLLNDPRWAGIAALLAIQGSIVLTRLPFYPGKLGLVFASIFLLLILERREAILERPSSALLAIALLAATTVTHFVTSVLLLCLLVGMLLVPRARGELKERFPSSRLAVYLVIPLAWLIYATVQTFEGLTHMGTEVLDNLGHETFLREVFIVGGSNFGPQVPLWAVIVKLFWLALLLGAGTMAALSRLRRPRSLPPIEARALGALLGILLLSVTATLVSTAGSQFLRYSMYAPLVVSPLLLLTLGRFTPGLRTAGLGAVVVSLVALAVPTFLASYSTVRTDAFYPYEEAAAQMLGRESDGTGVRLTAPAGDQAQYVGYLPQALFASTLEKFDLKDENGVWAYLDEQVNDFASGRGERVDIYVLSARPLVYFRHNFGIPLDDPHWDSIRSRLQGQAVVYDNGFVTLYEAIPPLPPVAAKASRR